MSFDDRPDAAKRLEQARVARGFATPKAAATYFGWKYETYIQHEQGIRGISRQAQKYAKALNVSEGWLLTGEGVGPNEPPALPSANLVPLVTWVSAGAFAREDGQQEAIGEVTEAGLDPRGDWIALTVDGDSMDRISPPGSIIFVNRRDKKLVPNACYVIGDGNNQVTYKRFRANPLRFEPVSTNPRHEPIFFEEMPTIVGRVKKTILEM